MNSFLLVFLGGGLGAAARHGVNSISMVLLGSRYPWGTFCINVLGSLLIGVLAEWFALQAQASAGLRLFLVTGILGGFTTFSAFSLEIGLLHERGATATAIAYAVLSVVCGVAAMFGGMAAVRQLSGNG
jgi:CrcB protein